MKVVLIFLLLTILVIVTLPYGLHKQIDELDKKNKIKNIESFYNASSSIQENCQSKIDEATAQCMTDKSVIQSKNSESNSRKQMELDKCMNDNMIADTKLQSKSTESINHQNNYSGCTESLSKLNSEIGTLTKNYDTLLNQFDNQQKTFNNNNTIINVTQETLKTCQNQNANNTDQISILQKQYNDLVAKYQELQKAYKELADDYHIKCYDYYINTRTSVPSEK